ncbi:MAG: hypothetical protein U0Q22_08425 [Acidimicrobiales bacterium]
MTTRRRRPHPALGARWVTAGLAVSTTVGMTSYLEIDHVLHPSPSSEAAASPAAPTTTVGGVTVPTAPDLHIIVVNPDGTVPTSAPAAAPQTVPPTVPQTAPVRTVPPRTVPPTTAQPYVPYVPYTPPVQRHATTRGSGG